MKLEHGKIAILLMLASFSYCENAMSDYFLHLYMVDHAELAAKFKASHDEVITEMGLKREENIVAMKKLLSRNYQRDEKTWQSDDADELIRALQMLTEFMAEKNTVIEFYLDDERLPQLWKFAFNDWDVVDDFALPLSPDGTPAVVYRNNKSLRDFLAQFKEMKSTGNYRDDLIDEENLDLLIDIVTTAVLKDSGLFIFCEQ